ncbi:MAG: type II toxin-antitoxin system death-on-curing family toxin [Candidatus Omnitrophica bacterium]|nr:type II toxin-antitoxin system death-on-curing family toxin [Candidatus Omnitrophota bacterium]
MKTLGYQQVLWIYRRVIEEAGGDAGLRDEGLLRSALARPQATFDGQDLYPGIFEKAAALAESIVRNHPFVDGNKRMAWECVDLTLDLNGYRLEVSESLGYEWMMRIIERKVTVQDVAEWLKKHSRRVKK